MIPLYIHFLCASFQYFHELTFLSGSEVTMELFVCVLGNKMFRRKFFCLIHFILHSVLILMCWSAQSLHLNKSGKTDWAKMESGRTKHRTFCGRKRSQRSENRMKRNINFTLTRTHTLARQKWLRCEKKC